MNTSPSCLPPKITSAPALPWPSLISQVISLSAAVVVETQVSGASPFGVGDKSSPFCSCQPGEPLAVMRSSSGFSAPAGGAFEGAWAGAFSAALLVPSAAEGSERLLVLVRGGRMEGHGGAHALVGELEQALLPVDLRQLQHLLRRRRGRLRARIDERVGLRQQFAQRLQGRVVRRTSRR